TVTKSLVQLAEGRRTEARSVRKSRHRIGIDRRWSRATDTRLQFVPTPQLDSVRLLLRPTLCAETARWFAPTPEWSRKHTQLNRSQLQQNFAKHNLFDPPYQRRIDSLFF